jgi:hypothetical protein
MVGMGIMHNQECCMIRKWTDVLLLVGTNCVIRQ